MRKIFLTLATAITIALLGGTVSAQTVEKSTAQATTDAVERLYNKTLTLKGDSWRVAGGDRQLEFLVTDDGDRGFVFVGTGRLTYHDPDASQEEKYQKITIGSQEFFSSGGKKWKRTPLHAGYGPLTKEELGFTAFPPENTEEHKFLKRSIEYRQHGYQETFYEVSKTNPLWKEAARALLANAGQLLLVDDQTKRLQKLLQ